MVLNLGRHPAQPDLFPSPYACYSRRPALGRQGLVAPLAMPRPEELGSGMRKPAVAPVDWTTIRARLDRVGATAFSLERAGTGYHFTCRLPAGRSADGRGATEADAIRQALEQAERK